MTYRVCIPTAGLGSRLGSLTLHLNKSLVSVANKPVISHIIEKFPTEVEFVVALGYMGQNIRDFLQLAYPERVFHFVEVTPYQGEGSGLGLTLLQCREFLQTPFIFCSCDTIVQESIPEPSENWMGYALLDDISSYRGVCTQGRIVTKICEKGTCADALPYIGLAGIHDFKIFWDCMISEGSVAVETGECAGLRGLITNGVQSRRFTWFDTGNIEVLEATREILRQPDTPNILEKANESIWFVGKSVIKFSADEEFIANRVARSASLGEWCPKITGSTRNMYKYEKVEGRVLSDIVTVPLFRKFLKETSRFWEKTVLSPEQEKIFNNDCKEFYETKTRKRIAQFYQLFNVSDGEEIINDETIPPLTDLLDRIDWGWVAKGTAVRFHGDFHFENILYDDATERFWFLDWRQDFAGKLDYGDIYYDLAKLYHGIIVSHGMIASGNYSVSWNDNYVKFDFHRKNTLVDCERYFEHFVTEAGYDWAKVKLLTYLIYLNIAALHHYPYSHLLYYLGKQGLCKTIQQLTVEESR